MKIKKIFGLFLILFLTHCGFSPIFLGDQKPIYFSKIEITGQQDLAFPLEQKLGLIKDEKNLKGNQFNAQVFSTEETSQIDERGVPIETIVKLTVSFEIKDKTGLVVYSGSAEKSIRVAITDNVSNNIIIKNNSRVSLLDPIAQSIKFKIRTALK
jgi:hypothetical protein